MIDGVKEFARRRVAPEVAPPPPSPRLRQAGEARQPAFRSGDDERFMARALALAAKGINTTHPNPRVGCVVVSGGAVAGEGWHRTAGGEHAEIIALKQAGKRAQGATLYVTLEPCCHHGRTPPCADAVIAAGVSRAVIAMEDPNPLVDGGGVAALRRAGIAVTLGVGAQTARRLNRGFAKRLASGRPWVTLKMAASLDGKTALASGESQWITTEAARRDAHKLRAAGSAILTGVGTVLRDDPRMTARLDDLERQPLRVILDSHLSTPRRAKILQPPGRVLIITAARGDDAARLSDDAKRLSDAGGGNVEVIACREHGGRVDLKQVMRELAAREINELLLEAGPRLSGGMLKAQLVDEVVVYLSPDLLGNDARGMFDLPGLAAMTERRRLKFRDVRRVGGDLRLSLDIADADKPAADCG